MAIKRVKARQDFSGPYSKSAGERFDYDVDKDEADLMKLGVVEVLDAEPKADGKK